MKPVTGYFLLTVNELRGLLFELDNQEMTVRELRQNLTALADLKQPAEQGISQVNLNAKRVELVQRLNGWLSVENFSAAEDVEYAKGKIAGLRADIAKIDAILKGQDNAS